MQHQRDAGLRSRRSFMAAAGTALGTAALGVPGRLLAAPADINVGVILPLSGANAQFASIRARAWSWSPTSSMPPAASSHWAAPGSSW